jgi:hypothetical protein
MLLMRLDRGEREINVTAMCSLLRHNVLVPESLVNGELEKLSLCRRFSTLLKAVIKS